MTVRGEDGDASTGHPALELAVAREPEPLGDGEAAPILHTGVEGDAARSERLASPRPAAPGRPR